MPASSKRVLSSTNKVESPGQAWRCENNATASTLTESMISQIAPFCNCALKTMMYFPALGYTNPALSPVAVPTNSPPEIPVHQAPLPGMYCPVKSLNPRYMESQRGVAKGNTSMLPGGQGGCGGRGQYPLQAPPQ